MCSMYETLAVRESNLVPLFQPLRFLSATFLDILVLLASGDENARQNKYRFPAHGGQWET